MATTTRQQQTDGLASWLAERLLESAAPIQHAEYRAYAAHAEARGSPVVAHGSWSRTLSGLLGPSRLARVHRVPAVANRRQA